MKKFNWFIVVLCTVMGTACSDDVEDIEKVKNQDVIELTLEGASDTRADGVSIVTAKAKMPSNSNPNSKKRRGRLWRPRKEKKKLL